MKKLILGALALGLAFGPGDLAFGWCVTVQNAKCEGGESAEPVCVPQPGATCAFDGNGCRSACDATSLWDECDPACPGGPDLQLP